MWLIKLAWRNLWRNKRRTLITISSLCFGLILALVFIGLSDGTYGTMIDNAARLGAGHITIEHPGYRKSLATRYTLNDTAPLVRHLNTMESVEGWAPRISGQAMLSTSYGSVGAAFTAVDPRQEQKSSLFIKKVVKGSYLTDSDGRGALIGIKIARRLKVSVGSKMVVTANNLQGEFSGELLRVVGIFETGSAMIDGYVFQIPLDRARKLLGMGDDEVSHLAVFLDNQRKTDRAEQKLRNAFAGIKNTAVLSWREVMPDLAAYIEIDGAANYIFQVIIFIIIGAGILNTILMSVMERRYEFGVHLCLGMSPASLLVLVIIEAVLLGLMGTAAGTLLGLAGNYYFTVKGLDMTLFTRENIDVSGVVLDPILYSDLYAEHLIVIVVSVFLLTVLVGIYPALKAARSVPIEVLRKQ